MSNPDPSRDYADYVADLPEPPRKIPGDCPACPGVGLVQASIYEFVCTSCGIRWEIGDKPTYEEGSR